MNVAVVGAGAMGCLYGGKLADVTEVWLVDPWPEHVATMQRDGLRITELDGTETVVRVRATTDPAHVPEADLAIIFVKSAQTEMAAEMAARFLKADGLALTMQNGVGNLAVIARVLGEERALQGVTAHGATLLGPGHIRHAGQGPTHLATRPDVAAKVEALAALFRQAGFETEVSDDLDSLIWGKVVINVGINALTAILRVPNGVLAEVAPARALMDEAVAEAVAVVEAKGIALPYDDPQKRVAEVAVATGANRSSMLQDVLRGAPTEIGVINEAVVREGERLGVETPVNRLLAALVRALEASYEQRV